MATTDQGIGAIERIFYVAVSTLVLKYGSHFGLTDADSPWLAAGILAAIAGVIGWVRNRPSSLMSRGASSLPDNAHMVLVTTAAATPEEKAEVRALATAASDKVTSKTSA